MSIAQLYTPSVSEITAAATSAKRRHPELSSRVDKAQAILSDGSLQLDATAWQVGQLVRWKVPSQSHGGAYVVSGLATLACPCEDRRAQQSDGCKCCKHSIAISLLSKILTNRINADIQARNIDLAILEDHTFHCYANRLGIVHMQKVHTAYTFCDSASMVRYSMWTARTTAAVVTPANVALALALALA